MKSNVNVISATIVVYNTKSGSVRDNFVVDTDIRWKKEDVWKKKLQLV